MAQDCRISHYIGKEMCLKSIPKVAFLKVKNFLILLKVKLANDPGLRMKWTG